MTRRVVFNKSKPWLLLIEFPSHGDAKAAQELLETQFSESMSLRPKHFHPADGNIANWRSTAALRAAFGPRDFRWDDIQAALLNAGYSDSGRSWLQRAHKYGVIERLSKGLYRFLPPASRTADGTPQVGQCGDPIDSQAYYEGSFGPDLHLKYSRSSDFTEHMEARHCAGCQPAPLERKP